MADTRQRTVARSQVITWLASRCGNKVQVQTVFLSCDEEKGNRHVPYLRRWIQPESKSSTYGFEMQTLEPKVLDPSFESKV